MQEFATSKCAATAASLFLAWAASSSSLAESANAEVNFVQESAGPRRLLRTHRRGEAGVVFRLRLNRLPIGRVFLQFPLKDRRQRVRSLADHSHDSLQVRPLAVVAARPLRLVAAAGMPGISAGLVSAAGAPGYPPGWFPPPGAPGYPPGWFPPPG